MTIRQFTLDDDLKSIIESWIINNTNLKKSSLHYYNKIIKQGWYDENDDIVFHAYGLFMEAKKLENPKGLNVSRVPPEYVQEFKKWLEVPNWLQEKDIEILERGIRNRYLNMEDWITIRTLDWAWQEEVNWEDAPFKKRTHNIVNTLEGDELITDYIRNLRWWVYEGKKSQRITQIKIGDVINLNDKKEIEDFRHKLSFIRDYQVYNEKWKTILNHFDEWFKKEYQQRKGYEYQPFPYEFKNLSEMFSNRLYVQQRTYNNLKELKKECW
jgi:hypothetical protein